MDHDWLVLIILTGSNFVSSDFGNVFQNGRSVVIGFKFCFSDFCNESNGTLVLGVV